MIRTDSLPAKFQALVTYGVLVSVSDITPGNRTFRFRVPPSLKGHITTKGVGLLKTEWVFRETGVGSHNSGQSANDDPLLVFARLPFSTHLLTWWQRGRMVAQGSGVFIQSEADSRDNDSRALVVLPFQENPTTASAVIERIASCLHRRVDLQGWLLKGAGMTRTTVRRHPRRAPTIVVAEPLLPILLAKDDGSFCAKCPELDLVTALPTADAAVEDLIEAMWDYAKEYLRDRDQYAASPNRAHHLPYIEAIAACKTDWALRTLNEIKPGLVHG